MRNLFALLLLTTVFFVPVIKSATYTVGPDGDFADIQSAISSASNGDTITILAGNTFTICTTLTINKELTIQGQNASTVVITCGALDTLLNVSSSNVTLKNFTVQNTKQGTDLETCIAQTTLNATGLVFDGLIIKTTEFGISLNASTYEIKNCNFVYIGTDATDRFRFIYSYGNNGNCKIIDNTFDGNGIVNLRSRPIALSDNDYPALRNFAGALEVTGNSFSNGGLDAFIVMDAFGGNTGDFSLTVTNNEVVNTPSERNGSFISFYATSNNPLDLFSGIVVSGNTYTSTKGVGLITIEGYGPDLSPFTNLFTVCDNVLSFTTVDASNYVDASGSALVAYDSTAYKAFTVGLSSCD